MPTVIKHKIGSGVPLASALVQGELAIDTVNGRMYTENSVGSVVELGTTPSTIDINAGTVDGISSLSTANGTDVSFAGVSATKFFWDASAESLGIGQGVYSTTHALNLKGEGLAIKNDKNGSNNNWSTINNTDTGSSSNLSFSTGGKADAVVFSHAGNVGIGTSSPSYALDVSTTASSIGGRITTTTSGSYLSFLDNGGLNGYVRVGSVDNNLVMLAGNAERARIDSSGNLLVGKTSANSNLEGCELRSGFAVFTSNANVAAIYNRKTSDGTIQEFQKDGTTVGSIGTSGGDLYFSNGTSSLMQTGSNTLPRGATGGVNDATVNLGNASNRFKDLYLSGGVYLGGTGAANHLDDYEEGTFTPTVHDAVTGGNTGSAGAAVGSYVKVGNMVTVWFSLTNIVTTGLTSGNAIHFGGLPFTISSTCLGQLTGNFAAVGTEVHQALLGNVGYTRTNIYVHYDGGNEGSIAVTNFTSGSGDFIGTLTYQTA